MRSPYFIVTEAATQGEEEHRLAALEHRFPGYNFALLDDDNGPVIVCAAKSDTIKHIDDVPRERDVLQFLVTALLDELVTGHTIIN